MWNSREIKWEENGFFSWKSFFFFELLELIFNVTLWKLPRLTIHSGWWWWGNECAVQNIGVAEIIGSTDHLEKYLVPGTRQVADAEKDYKQESTTWDFLVHSLIMQHTVPQELSNPQLLSFHLMPSDVFSPMISKTMFWTYINISISAHPREVLQCNYACEKKCFLFVLSLCADSFVWFILLLVERIVNHQSLFTSLLLISQMTS